MKKPHALVLSLMLGTAAVAGVLALSQTVDLGQASRQTSTTQIDSRQTALTRAERQIARLQADVPPALPAAPVRTQVAAPQVVVVRSTATAGHQDEHEAEGDGHGWDDQDEHEDDGWDD